MTRKLIHVLVALTVLLGATTFAPTANALSWWRFINYYEGCYGSLVLVGTATRNCSGVWSYWGQQSGDWKDVNDVSCTGSPIEYGYFYEYCNGNWVPVDEIEGCPCQ